MAANRYTYQGKRLLFDVTVTQVKPGASLRTVITGSSNNDPSGASNVTRIGSAQALTSTALSGLYGDLTDLIIIPAVDSAGAYPDVAVWPVVDGVDYADRIMIDGSVPGNMFPNPANAIGRVVRRLGVPMRQAFNGRPGWAMKATGLKAARQYQFMVYSAAGFGNSGAATTPLRIIGYGDKLNGQALDQLAAMVARTGYQGQVQNFAPGYNSLVAVHTINGGLSTKTWTALPGGPTQQGVKINRFFRYAYNAQPTANQGLYVMSNDNAVQGAQGNVMDANHDLGFNFENSQDYLMFLEFGARTAANQAYVGFRVDDTILPDDNGFVVSQGVNPLAYGNVQPQRPGTNEFYALGAAPWTMIASQNKLSFFIAADGTDIPAGDSSLAVGGVLVQQGNGN